MPLIGFQKLCWQPPSITVPPGMEIDIGGFGKEYAVDRVLAMVAGHFAGAALVNFGRRPGRKPCTAQRYSHILDVRTGWPVADVPRSVTVAAASCVEAGMLATFAMLQGREVEAFLDSQGVRYWCLR